MKKHFFAFGLPILLLAFCQPVACAQTPVEISIASPTHDLIDEASRLLSRGKKLNVAISFYQEAVRREPKNAAFHTYLACAQAARGFSMAQYLRDDYLFKSRKELYVDFSQQQEQARQNKENPLYNIILPSAPAPPQWPDGDKAKPSTDEGVKELLRKISTESLSELRKANDIVNSKQYIASDKVEMLTLQGWSALLLFVGPYRFVEVPERDTTLSLLKASLNQTVDKPTDIRQTQRVADALLIAANYPVVIPTEKFVQDKRTAQEGIDLAIAAAPKARNKGAAWYWIAANQANREHGEPINKDGALTSYKKAVYYAPSNGLYHYTLASCLATRQQKWTLHGDNKNTTEEIFQQIKEGNACSSISTIDYAIAAPSLVRWAFLAYPFSEFYNVATLSQVLGQLQGEEIEGGNLELSFSTIKVTVQCGSRFLEAAKLITATDQQKLRYFSSGRTLLTTAGYAVMYLKSQGKTVPKELDYSVSFVPERHRSGTNPSN